jgi:hypothetical protein
MAQVSGAHQLPHRSTLSRLLAALDQASVEALRSLCARGSACAARRAYHLLELEVVKLQLLRTPDQVSTHPRSVG